MAVAVAGIVATVLPPAAKAYTPPPGSDLREFDDYTIVAYQDDQSWQEDGVDMRACSNGRWAVFDSRYALQSGSGYVVRTSTTSRTSISVLPAVPSYELIRDGGTVEFGQAASGGPLVGMPIYDSRWEGEDSGTVKLRCDDNDLPAQTQQQIAELQMFTSVPADPPTADFDFAASPSNPREITFTNRSSDADDSISDLEFLWTFHDGTTSTERDPVKTYATAGTFSVSLRATDTDGQTDTATQSVEIAPLGGSWARVDGAPGFDVGEPAGVRLSIVNVSGEALSGVELVDASVTTGSDGGTATIEQSGPDPAGTLAASGAGATATVDFVVEGVAPGRITLTADVAARTPAGAAVTATVERAYEVRSDGVAITLVPAQDPIELEAVDEPQDDGSTVRTYTPKVVVIAVHAANVGDGVIDQVRMPDDLSFLAQDGFVGPARIAIVGGPCESASACRRWDAGGLADVHPTYGPLAAAGDDGDVATAYYLTEVRRPGAWEALAVATWTQAGADETASGRAPVVAVGPPGTLSGSFEFTPDDTYRENPDPVEITSEDGRLVGEIFAGDEIAYEGEGWNASGLPIGVTIGPDAVTEHPAAEAFAGTATVTEVPVRPARDPDACSVELVADQGGRRSLVVQGELMGDVRVVEGSFAHPDGSTVAVGDALCTGSDPSVAAGESLLVADVRGERERGERVHDWNGWWLGGRTQGKALAVRGGVLTNYLYQIRSDGPRRLPRPDAHELGRLLERPFMNGVLGSRSAVPPRRGTRLELTPDGLRWHTDVRSDVVATDLRFDDRGGGPCRSFGDASMPLINATGTVFVSGSISGAGQIVARTIWIDAAGSLDPCAASDDDYAVSLTADAVILGPVARASWVTEAASAGDTKVEVASHDSFELGSTVVIDPGGEHPEEAVLIGFGSLLLDRPLQFDHAPGTLVVDADNPPTDIPGLAEILAGDAPEVERGGPGAAGALPATGSAPWSSVATGLGLAALGVGVLRGARWVRRGHVAG